MTSETGIASKGTRFAAWTALVLLTIWAVLPILWSLSASFKTPLTLYSEGFIPENPTLDNYGRVLSSEGFYQYLGNSLYLAITSTVLTLFVSVLAAYGFARYAFAWRHVLLLFILVPRILPRASLIIPLYDVIARLDLLDTYTVLIVTYTATAVPMATWILIGFFQAVPRELEEAAAIDGASIWQRIWGIVVPISLPGMVTAGILSLREAWNEFPFVLAFTTSGDMRTLPFQLFAMRDNMGLTDWPLINAFTITTIIPILFLYLLFERQIVSGLTSGAVK
ncbi:ABC-type glycerol-3-phosphate transport system permease component [Limimaricola variabilis]|uniref:ABC-type glycerol-3-phosphate transport system permease component n=1 Tax=Limimaricola variabilis TaxID=1492771 RepID=A0ABR6HR84_9RHOB|nr:carbohydrate ABC transporter permease [Limimaricola variabilis]MBB3713058.1 ABC-type glycerol-3-phosphate transport system permease component [Limimaricola variabilis]